MGNDIEQSKLFERLKNYRVDFCHSKGQFFVAARRIREENERRFIKKRVLIISSLITAILTGSGVAFYFTKIDEKATVLVMGVFALISIAISIYLVIEKREDNADDFQKRAEEYLDLFKQAKNLEAKIIDGQAGLGELSKEIDRFQVMQHRISSQILITTDSDYSISKKQIDDGGCQYTEEEYKNC